MPVSTRPAADAASGTRDPSAATPIPLVFTRLNDLQPTAGHAAIIRAAAARIDAWVPKGVHFGWERSFRNKGKFPAGMSKDDVRQLVAGLLRTAPLAILCNHREGVPADQEVRVVADAQAIIGTRGQRRVRIIIVPAADGPNVNGPNAGGYVVDNAFPVHER